MEAIFQTGFIGKAAAVRIGDRAYRAVGQDLTGTLLVEAPVEVGLAQGWTRRLDLEAARAEAPKKGSAEKAKDKDK